MLWWKRPRFGWRDLWALVPLLAFVLAKLGMAQPAVAAFNESVRLIGPDDADAAALRQILKETAGPVTEAPSP